MSDDCAMAKQCLVNNGVCDIFNSSTAYVLLRNQLIDQKLRLIKNWVIILRTSESEDAAFGGFVR